MTSRRTKRGLTCNSTLRYWLRSSRDTGQYDSIGNDIYLTLACEDDQLTGEICDYKRNYVICFTI